MLLKFRERIGFCQYMLSKPGRYDIKFWLFADSANHYCYNIITYLGKGGGKVATNFGVKVVKDLAEHFFSSGENII